MGGDSAGGNLAAVVAQQRVIPIVFQLLVYPSVDMRMLTPSFRKYAEGYGLSYKMCLWFKDHYMGKQKKDLDPRASPYFAEREVIIGLPPALIILAECDVLKDDGELYASMFFF